ncbi:unnamed protein product [Lampetra fluviatilis]
MATLRPIVARCTPPCSCHRSSRSPARCIVGGIDFAPGSGLRKRQTGRAQRGEEIRSATRGGARAVRSGRRALGAACARFNGVEARPCNRTSTALPVEKNLHSQEQLGRTSPLLSRVFFFLPLGTLFPVLTGSLHVGTDAAGGLCVAGMMLHVSNSLVCPAPRHLPLCAIRRAP